jgi:hypothetical protein
MLTANAAERSQLIDGLSEPTAKALLAYLLAQGT